MKKLFLVIIFSVVLAAPAFIFAQTNISNPGLTPDSPLYFLKAWKEQIQTFFTFGVENKARQYLHLAEVRLAEYQKMLDEGKTKIAEQTLDKYNDQLDRALQKIDEAKNQGRNIRNLLQQVEQSSVKRIEVLEQNLQKVPEQAKEGIQRALENSKTKLERFQERLRITPTPIISPTIIPTPVISSTLEETANWKIYRNEQYRFEIKYPSSFSLQEQSDGDVVLRQYNNSIDAQHLARIYVYAGKDLSAAILQCGGRCSYSKSLVAFSEKSGDWNKDYIFDYGGMGDWFVVVNAYQQRKGNYYILSLWEDVQLGVPAMNGEEKPTWKEVVAPELKNLQDTNNNDIRTFNQILSTFRFLK